MNDDRTIDASAADDIADNAIARLAKNLAPLRPSLSPAECERLRKIVASIARWGARFNLTSKPDNSDSLARHLLDSLSPTFSAAPEPIRETFRAKRRALDIGGGAGFPGLALAAVCEAHFTIAESRRHRASFLEVAAREAELANVHIDARRLDAENIEPKFDAVISRALARPRKFWALASAALAPDGVAILWARRGQTLDLDDARACGLSVDCEFTYPVDADGSPDHLLIAMRRR